MGANWMPPMRINGHPDNTNDVIVHDWGGTLIYEVDKSEPDSTAFDFSKKDRKIIRLGPYQSKKLMLWLMMNALS